MAVFLWISSDREIFSLVPWGRWLANQIDQELIILCYGGAFGSASLLPIEDQSETENLLVRACLDQALSDEKVYVIRGRQCLNTLGSEPLGFTAQAGSCIISGRQGRKSIIECHEDILPLLDKIGLCWLILRCNNQKPKDHALKILIPASGSSESHSALDLLKRFHEDHKVSLLHSVSDGAEQVMQAGYLLLNSISQKFSLEHLQPNLIVRPSESIQKALMEEIREGYHLVIAGSSNTAFVDRLLYKSLDEELFLHSQGSAILLVHTRSSNQKNRNLLDEWLIATVPQLDREQRIQLHQHLLQGTVSSYDFISLIVLSTGIAALGLIQNSVAIIIGAMLVAPLMTPMLGAGLAIVQGNLMLIRAAAVSIGVGFCLSLLLGYCIGFMIPSQSLSAEILARTEPNILDLFVALFSGIAAAYSTARPGLMGALPGVAIAAALVPPITSAGIALASGQASEAFGAVSLFGINLVLIILASASTLYCMGIRPVSNESNQRLWARRSIQLLLLIAVVISIPLAVRMVSGISQDYPNLRVEVLHLIPVDSQLLNLKLSHDESNLKLQLEIGSPYQRDASELSLLAAQLRNLTQPDARIEIKVTHLWIDEPRKPRSQSIR